MGLPGKGRKRGRVAGSSARRRAEPGAGRDLERAVREFLAACGFRRLSGELRQTPARVARAWSDELLSGYAEDPARLLAPLVTARGRDLVAVRDIPFVSTCAHHLLPFHGRVHVAYLPSGRIAGVSRLGALVRCLSRRLQIQEDLTREIAGWIHRSLRPRGAACVIEATHLCLSGRGERLAGATVATSVFTGIFAKDARRRVEVLGLLGAGRGGRRRSATGRRGN